MVVQFDHGADAVNCALSCETVLSYEYANKVDRYPDIIGRRHLFWVQDRA